ncbi:MAG: 5'-methylthioadenosine phosphorylase [Lewinellaceae bacterium]|nr:hypothetical protein [Phaeodactylibacter sp.]MCB0611662.1 hypothetical protein [Phaeodactylibacter sp.]MCB9347457.1 5'-methylthioadenosine phosphorylase [Lewinellaceae bacterium]
MKSIAIILGSAFSTDYLKEYQISKEVISTPYGDQELYKVIGPARPAYLLFRHGLPHSLLPNQINYRAQAAALKQVDCGALLATSSVGVMDKDLPLFQPMLVDDLIMLDNRLPDGSTCTMFEKPGPGHAHLVLNEGLFSLPLRQHLQKITDGLIAGPGKEVVFAYAGGPRGKTAAENRMWIRVGANVNSMTLAPEIVLANEMEIPCAGLVIGHKYSVPGYSNPDEEGVSVSLDRSREATRQIILRFIEKGEPVAFGNLLYRFH